MALLSSVLAPPHPAMLDLIREYAAQYGGGEEEIIAREGVSLRVGKSLCVLQAMPFREIACQARLLLLPPPGAERDELVLRFAKLACARLLKSPFACMVDSRERGIWLRNVVPASTIQELERVIDMLSDEVQFWRELSGISFGARG